MKVIYTIGPYRNTTIYGISLNIEKARYYASRLWAKGYAVICPQLNSQYFDGVVEDQVFLDGDLEILKRCDMAFVMPGYSKSKGSLAEITFCEKHNIPVFYEIEKL